MAIIFSGVWLQNKLIRLMKTINLEYQIPQIDDIDRKVFLNSWYDKEAILYEVLSPQNIFFNKNRNLNLNQLARDDPFLEQVLEDKRQLIDEYLKICTGNSRYKIETHNKFIDVPNITYTLVEIFKHKEKCHVLNDTAKEKYNLDLTIIDTGKYFWHIFSLMINNFK